MSYAFPRGHSASSMRGSKQTTPDYPAAMAQIQSLSKEQLQELLDDETKFDALIKSLDQVRIASCVNMLVRNYPRRPLRRYKSDLFYKYKFTKKI